MNCAQDITRYMILPFLEQKDKLKFSQTCTENYKCVLKHLNVNSFNDLKCETHNRLDECSYIVPNTCRFCRTNYCNSCYKITANLKHEFVTERREYFTYNTCKYKCIYKCIKCNKIAHGQNWWLTSYEDPVNKYLDFNYYNSDITKNDIEIQCIDGIYKYKTEHMCEECMEEEAAEELFGTIDMNEIDSII